MKGFHGLLDEAVGHSTPSKEICERLALTFWHKILLIKTLAREEFGLNILECLKRFPLELDNTFASYYEKITRVFPAHPEYLGSLRGDYYYYVVKKKTIYLENGCLFYEYTLSDAKDNNSKFDTFLAFSTIDVFENYCIKAHFEKDVVSLFGTDVTVHILTAYQVAIRPCEMEKIALMIDLDFRFKRGEAGYNKLMVFIQEERMSLDKIVKLGEEDFSAFLGKVFNKWCQLKTLLLRLWGR